MDRNKKPIQSTPGRVKEERKGRAILG